MKGVDRFLVAIVAGSLVLVVAVLVLVATTSGEVQYRPDSTPEGVALNYLIALQKDDLERAYGYLAPAVPGRPRNVALFRRDLDTNPGQVIEIGLALRDVIMSVASVEPDGSITRVRITQTRYYGSGALSRNEYSTSFAMVMRQYDGAWRVRDVEGYPLGGVWADCWDSTAGCTHR